jgi:tight adherence protein B
MSALLCAALVVVVGAITRNLARVPSRTRQKAEPRARYRWGRMSGSDWWLARRRRLELRRAWPSVADELAVTVRAGTSMQQALASVADRGGAAAAVVREVIGPIDRGRSLADAAVRWAGLAGSPDEALLAEAVHLAAASGRPDPMLFETVADAMRERTALRGDLRAQTAQARASAGVLAVLPIAFTMLVSSTDPDVVKFLFGTAAGWCCVVVGLVLEGSGAWWMHRLIRSIEP